MLASAFRPRRSLDWPSSVGRLGAEWLTKALVPAGDPASVATFDVLSRSDGTTNRVRLGLTYNRGHEGLPASVFVKYSPSLSHRIALNASGMTDQESWFYSELRPLVPLATPELLAFESHPASGRFVLVLEDLAASSITFNDASKALTRSEAEAERLVDSLAALHAGMWEDRRLLHPRFSAPAHGRYADFFRIVNWPLLKMAVARGGCELLPPGMDLKKLQNRFWQQLELDSRAPMTMIHGDCHAGNWYFTDDGSPGLYDWQLVRRGSWAYDYGYSLISALGIEDRRTWERDLLARYIERLREHGVTGAPAFDEAWRHYRRQSAYGLVSWLETLGLGNFQELDVTTETIRRFGQAAQDHGLIDDQSLWDA